jgi:thymidylate synthase ThyX
MVDRYNEILKEVTNGFESKKILRDEELEIAKNNLPEGYLQRRVVCLNYKVLRNMFMQRHTHRLKYWKFFISEVIKQVKHPQFLEIK